MTIFQKRCINHAVVCQTAKNVTMSVSPHRVALIALTNDHHGPPPSTRATTHTYTYQRVQRIQVIRQDAVYFGIEPSTNAIPTAACRDLRSQCRACVHISAVEHAHPAAKDGHVHESPKSICSCMGDTKLCPSRIELDTLKFRACFWCSFEANILLPCRARI